MKSLFDPVHNQEIIDRIHTLTPASQALWGKMNVSQMLAHSQQPLRVAYGELQLKRSLLGVIFGGMVKRMMVNDEKPFKPNSPTDKTFIISDNRDFEQEKKKLIELIQRFSKEGPAGIRKDPHPFFGKLTNEEWDILQWKHLDHHLRQFAA
jgi:hypothetical protein